MHRIFIGEFRGTDFPTESVLAMACNSNSSVLATGDTQGFIYIWDIKDYCITPTPQVLRELNFSIRLSTQQCVV